MNEVRRLRRQSLVSAFRPAILDRHVLAVYVAGLLQSLAKRDCVKRIPLRRCAVEESDHRHRRLLCPRRLRPRSRAAEQRDELAPFHSITSSASASNLSGISRPSILARSGLYASHCGLGKRRTAGVDEYSKTPDTGYQLPQEFQPL